LKFEIPGICFFEGRFVKQNSGGLVKQIWSQVVFQFENPGLL
jgi:hypothetical protein